MEFSFGAQRWVPRDAVTGEQGLIERGYALGLHAPGFFDKVLHVNKCLLQSEATNKVFFQIGSLLLRRRLVSLEHVMIVHLFFY